MEEDTELDEVRLSRLKAELEKARRKRDEWDGKVKDLERRYKEAENTCIHEMVHAACLSPEQLAELIRAASIPDHYDPMLVIAVGKPNEKVVLTEAAGSVKYYRDEADVHYVPKRRLEDIVSGDVTVK